MPPSAALDFNAAAHRVQQRVLLRRWLACMDRTLILGASALAVALADMIIGRAGIALPLGMLAIWIAITAWLALRQKPSTYAALAAWDAAAGRREAFAAAWWIAGKDQPTQAEERHVSTQHAVLPSALQSLAHDLPLPWRRAQSWVPLLLLAALVWPALRPLEQGDHALSDPMKEAAAQEGALLAKAMPTPDKLQGLTAEEQAKVAELQAAVQAAAADLEKGEADTAKALLAALEARAHEAEKLAKDLGTRADAWGSKALIEALRQRADTADLGDASASRLAPAAATASLAIAAKLRALGDAVPRLKAGLNEVSEAAEEPDRQRLLGQHILGANDDLAKDLTSPAARQFEVLAKKLQDLSQREESARELAKLAQQLRDAGSRIAGDQAGALAEMPNADDASNAAPPSTEGSPQAAPMQAPGLAQPTQLMTTAPTGPQEKGDTDAVVATPAPGGQKPEEGPSDRPLLFAPIPGQRPDEQPDAVMQAPPIPGQPGNAQANAQTNGKAGNASVAPKAAPPSNIAKAKGSDRVQAQSGTDGSTTHRAIDGAIRNETATTSASTTTTEFIQQQEAALDESALPPNRRDQVRRYFQALRQRFAGK